MRVYEILKKLQLKKNHPILIDLFIRNLVNYPAASCGALKIKTELLLLLVSYVPTDEFRGDFVSNRPNEISVIP